MNETSANLMEVFSSVQGEGMFIGVRQVFLRFQACNLDCIYCDTGRNIDTDYCTVEGTPGRRDFVRIDNPVSIDAVAALLDRWQAGWPGTHHSISLTGGEPLLSHAALAAWLPVLKKRLPIYLETNGTLHATLASIIRFIDYISMDIKLPSTSGITDMWEHHRQFLKVAVQKNVFVKIVVDSHTEDWEIARSCELISSISDAIPLVLQPVTKLNGEPGISPLRALELHELAAGYLRGIRLIPQTHKFLGLL